MRKTLLSTSIFGLTAAQTAFAPVLASTEGWELLREIDIQEQITETSYVVTKVFPAALENGIEQFDLTGYVVLWGDGAASSGFMLISDMGFCPFCGDPAHGTALEVTLESPVEGLSDGDRVTVRGALSPVRDPQTSQTTRMSAARILP